MINARFAGIVDIKEGRANGKRVSWNFASGRDRTVKESYRTAMRVYISARTR